MPDDMSLTDTLKTVVPECMATEFRRRANRIYHSMALEQYTPTGPENGPPGVRRYTLHRARPGLRPGWKFEER